MLFGLLLALVLAWVCFNHQIQHSLAAHTLLNASTPREELLDQVAKDSANPVGFLQRCWATGRIPHRQFVAAFLKDHAGTNLTWAAQAEPLMLACTTDADSSVRELGLAALERQHNPGLIRAAEAQLDDVDPLVRLLGLDYLRKSDLINAVPLLIRLLDDADPRVVAAAEVGLMRATGEDYGVRARLAISPDPAHPAELAHANAEILRRGVERRKQWWRIHEKEYATEVPAFAHRAQNAFATDSRPPALDFTLRELDGKGVKLSEFRGKVVVLNFWATWCTACLAEIPDLIALQRKLGDRVVVLGVALDGVPDEDGDSEGGEATSRKPDTSLKAVRTKVERAVRARGINYTVLLDPKGSVGGQYNGGELPTTVIIDPEGRVRRRFVGGRNLAVFEAMVTEVGKPRAQP